MNKKKNGSNMRIIKNNIIFTIINIINITMLSLPIIIFIEIIFPKLYIFMSNKDIFNFIIRWGAMAIIISYISICILCAVQIFLIIKNDIFRIEFPLNKSKGQKILEKFIYDDLEKSIEKFMKREDYDEKE